MGPSNVPEIKRPSANLLQNTSPFPMFLKGFSLTRFRGPHTSLEVNSQSWRFAHQYGRFRLHDLL